MTAKTLYPESGSRTSDLTDTGKTVSFGLPFEGRDMSRIVLTMMCAVLAGGCGTLTNQSERNWADLRNAHTSNRAYGGIRTDFENIDRYYLSDDGKPIEGQMALWNFMTLDLPLCLVSDTILLPYDMWATLSGKAQTTPGIGVSDYLNPSSTSLRDSRTSGSE